MFSEFERKGFGGGGGKRMTGGGEGKGVVVAGGGSGRERRGPKRIPFLSSLHEKDLGLLPDQPVTC